MSNMEIYIFCIDFRLGRNQKCNLLHRQNFDTKMDFGKNNIYLHNSSNSLMSN